jgi:hypothetical protein
MKWLLIIALFDPRANAIIQIDVPMADEATCNAAKAGMKMERRWNNSDVQWLDVVCEPGSPR